MSLNLVKKHRPKRLEDVHGQERACSIIKKSLNMPQPPALLLAGPSGTGKTTLARIIGMTVACEHEERPCGECRTCLAIWQNHSTFHFSEINGAKFDEARHAKVMTEFMEGPAIGNWTTFIDEGQGLSKGAVDVLLKPIEDPMRDKRIVIATTRPEAIHRTLRDRCQIVPVLPLRPPSLYRLVTSIAESEGLRIEPRAVDMIVASAEGSARQALQVLDVVSDFDSIRPEHVANQLSLGTAGLVMRYLREVLSANSAGQDDVLHEWQAEPRDIVKIIRDMLLLIYNMDASPNKIQDIVNPAFFEIEESDRIELAAGFRAHALRRKRPFADFMLDCLAQWEFDPAIITDRSSLIIRVRRFDRLVNGDEPPLDPDEVEIVSRPSQSRIRRRSASSKGSRKHLETGHLSLRQAEDIYEMASFLPQHHGELLNTRIELHLPDHDTTGRKVPRLISSLTHALALRVNVWARTPAHWIYVHSQEESGLRTRIAFHLPPAALGKVEKWLNGWKRTAKDAGETPAHIVLDAQSPNRAVGYDRNRIQRHWFIFRWLAGGLDPTAQHWPDEEARGERVPVVDLLKISSDMRYSTGELGRMNAIGGSRSLGPASRKEAAGDRLGFLSAFEDCAWSRLQEGWELKEYADRQLERFSRQEAVERLELEFPPGNTRLERDAHEAALQRLVTRWPEDPRERARSWRGWW